MSRVIGLLMAVDAAAERQVNVRVVASSRSPPSMPSMTIGQRFLYEAYGSTYYSLLDWFARRCRGQYITGPRGGCYTVSASGRK